MIIATFTLSSHPATVRWEDGAISGPAGAVSYLQALAARLEGQPVDLAGFDGTTTNHLAAARSFCALCAIASDDYPRFTVVGDEPDLEPSDITTFPEGALL
ncbi:hypothetical protein EKD04_009415 [Chloroflexales bacterium ZM16-3]|nr:hypothetical protein [Chloroflexales bacterium ZM16-3]